ncbi:DUF1800 family protein [Massilia consociata]|uniref:DUF1800 family protein n=1 Tax=Massilia consociata TaxID=760117 RepID=A0ABV6FIK2_9BURK
MLFFRAALALLVLSMPLHARAEEAADARQALHLLNRLGYGPAPGDVARVQAMGPRAYVDSRLAQLDGKPVLPPWLGARLRELEEMQAGESGAGADALAREERLLRAIASPRQLEEVLLGFWLGHFGITAGEGMAPAVIAAIERQALRPQLFGRYSALRAAVMRHPAMHGRPVGGEREARRALARYFVSRPTAALERSLARTWERSGGDQRTVLRALLGSPDFLAPLDAGSREKDAFRFVVSAVRMSGLHVENAAPLVDVLERAGTPVYGLGGPMTAAARADFVARLGNGRLPLALAPPRPHRQASSAPPMRVGVEGDMGGMVAQPGPVLTDAPTPAAAAMAAARSRPADAERLVGMLMDDAFLRY